MSELTKDRVERAMDYYKGVIIMRIYSDRDRPDLEEPALMAETALAALDAVMWRSPETMPDYHDVLVAFRRTDGSVGCAITVKLEIPEFVTVLGWRPVLMWEDEA